MLLQSLAALWSWLTSWFWLWQLRYKIHVDGGSSTLRDSHCLALAVLLREPCRVVRQLLTAHRRFRLQLDGRRNRPQSKWLIQQHLNSFHVPQEQALKQLFASDSRNRILVSFHFGDYVYGMNYLSGFLPTEHDLAVLSHQSASQVYLDNIRKGFGESAKGLHSEILTEGLSLTDLSAQLRAGKLDLILFCDLPTGFGEQTQVEFLQHKAWFPRGPAALAVINKIPILPVINFFDGNHNRVEVAPQIEARIEAGEDLQACVDRITQQLISYFQRHFLRNPEQWRYLESLPLYFSEANNKAVEDNSKISSQMQMEVAYDR